MFVQLVEEAGLKLMVGARLSTLFGGEVQTLVLPALSEMVKVQVSS